MRTLYFTALVFLIFLSCAPVLRKDTMRQGVIDFEFSEITENMKQNKGRLFIMGGVIVKTDFTKEGSLIEAVYVPVNSRGYLEEFGRSSGRFLALHRTKKLDPFIYSKKRYVTLAGELIGTRKGMIDKTDYVYPLFEIREIYLWEDYEIFDRYRYHPYYYDPYPHYWFRFHYHD